MQAGKEGRYTLPDWCRLEGLSWDCAGQSRDWYWLGSEFNDTVIADTFTGNKILRILKSNGMNNLSV